MKAGRKPNPKPIAPTDAWYTMIVKAWSTYAPPAPKPTTEAPPDPKPTTEAPKTVWRHQL
jgi:hypothetical protein